MKCFEALLQPSKAFLYIAIALKVRSISYLDEAFVALGEQAAEEQDVLVIHYIGNHRSAVVIGLQANLAQALQRPAAGPHVHGFINETTHFLLFFFRESAPGFGVVEAHYP